MSGPGANFGGGCCYYSVLGLREQVSADEIPGAYRKLAMKWHPDRWMKVPEMAAESKRRVQQIQEAYSVLSNKSKRSKYDAGLISFLTDDYDERFCDFMNEMVSMTKDTTEQGKKKKKYSLEDLRGSLMNESPPLNAKKKRSRVAEI